VLTEAALPLLDKAEFPRIVNVSSALGSHGHLANPSSPWYHVRAIVSPSFNSDPSSPRNAFVDTNLTHLLVQAYNTGKSALNGLTVHFAYVLGQKNTNSRVIAVDPGYNATNINGNSGPQHPSIGAAGILRFVTAGPGENGYNTAEYRDQFGEVVPW
jgi:NAD(P)-dependent dehydrogenase (short-subunit alcohol dehydrogenase family)